MITGVSTADLAIVLVDARHGVVEQTRRHSLLDVAARRAAPGDRRQQDGPRRPRRGPLRRDRAPRSSPSSPAASTCARHVHPDLGADRGQRRRAVDEHGVVPRPDAAAPPRDGVHGERRQPTTCASPCSTSCARSAPSTATTAATPARSPPGTLRAGDEVVVLPSGADDPHRAHRHADGPVARGRGRSMAVTVRLTDDVDISRGDMIWPAHNHPTPSPGPRRRWWRGWTRTTGLAAQRPYTLKHTTRRVRAMVTDVRSPARRARPDALATGGGCRHPDAQRDRSRVAAAHRRRCSSTTTAATGSTGSFVLIDEATNQTVAAGMIRLDGAADPTSR